MKTHVSEDPNNLVNSVLVTFCDTCKPRVMSMDLDAINRKYMRRAEDLIAIMNTNHIGVINMRMKWPGYLVVP